VNIASKIVMKRGRCSQGPFRYGDKEVYLYETKRIENPNCKKCKKAYRMYNTRYRG